MSEAVKHYLDAARVNYKIHVADGPTMTARDAATRLRIPLETIIKSIVFTAQDGSPLIAIVTGDRRVDKTKLSTLAGAGIKIATAEAAKTLTGFEVGSMPPLGHRSRIPTVIDQKVMSFSRIYGGAGTPDALIELNPHDIARLADAKIADIRE
jgi:Cys-tRNA(Pro) deacylase